MKNYTNLSKFSIPLLITITLINHNKLESETNYMDFNENEKIIKDEIILVKTGKYNEAIFKLETKLIDYPNNSSIYYFLGKAYQKLNNKIESLKNFTKATKIDPNYAKPFMALGLISGKENKLEETIDYLDKAIQIDPNYAKAYSNRGVTKGALSNNVGAISDFTKALEIDPFLTEAYVNRGITYELMGDLNLACSDWRSADSLGNKSGAKWFKEQCKETQLSNYDSNNFNKEIIDEIKSLKSKINDQEKIIFKALKDLPEDVKNNFTKNLEIGFSSKDINPNPIGTIKDSNGDLIKFDESKSTTNLEEISSSINSNYVTNTTSNFNDFQDSILNEDINTNLPSINSLSNNSSLQNNPLNIDNRSSDITNANNSSAMNIPLPADNKASDISNVNNSSVMNIPLPADNKSSDFSNVNNSSVMNISLPAENKSSDVSNVNNSSVMNIPLPAENKSSDISNSNNSSVMNIPLPEDNKSSDFSNVNNSSVMNIPLPEDNKSSDISNVNNSSVMNIPLPADNKSSDVSNNFKTDSVISTYTNNASKLNKLLKNSNSNSDLGLFALGFFFSSTCFLLADKFKSNKNRFLEDNNFQGLSPKLIRKNNIFSKNNHLNEIDLELKETTTLIDQKQNLIDVLNEKKLNIENDINVLALDIDFLKIKQSNLKVYCLSKYRNEINDNNQLNEKSEILSRINIDESKNFNKKFFKFN